MPVKPVTTWGKRSAKVPEDQISNCTIHASALKRLVLDTVVEVRGEFALYRPGDVVKQVHGVRFHR
jgi:hypothetical protein